MHEQKQAELEIEVTGPIVMAFWNDDCPVDIVDREQPMQRSFVTADDLHNIFLLVKDGAHAVGAVAWAIGTLKKAFGKNPDVIHRVSIKVRFGTTVDENAVRKLSELGCDIEYSRETVQRFDAGSITPKRASAEE